MGMAERGSGSRLVVVAAADPFVGQVARIIQLGDCPLCGASSDAGYVTPSNIGVLRNEDQDSGVVGEKRRRPPFGIGRYSLFVEVQHTLQIS